MAHTLTLESIDTTVVSVPLRRPVLSKVGMFERWPLILIDLHTREGITGHSYLEPYLEKSTRYIVPAMHDLVEARRGKQLSPMKDLPADRKRLNLVGLEGVTMIAAAGLDMAAWDALAKAAGLPLATYLGGSVGEVAAYNSNGLWLSALSTLGKEAKELVSEGGFDALKLRLGRDRAIDDVRAIELIRESVGSDVKLMVDFNQGRTFGDALERCHALDSLGIYWFEEPIAYDDFRGCADLKSKLRTPIQIGENFYGPRDMYQAITQAACDYVMPDLMRIGGITGWLRSAPIAAAAGLQVSTHLYPEVSAHLMQVTETAHWLEWQDWANPIIEQPFELRSGKLVIPERPGSGVSWNRQAMKKYTIGN